MEIEMLLSVVGYPLPVLPTLCFIQACFRRTNKPRGWLLYRQPATRTLRT